MRFIPILLFVIGTAGNVVATPYVCYSNPNNSDGISCAAEGQGINEAGMISLQKCQRYFPGYNCQVTRCVPSYSWVCHDRNGSWYGYSYDSREMAIQNSINHCVSELRDRRTCESINWLCITQVTTAPSACNRN
jgi:hypothetical protein